ncbi:MAG: AMP-binding protein [Gloeotrichia echinulata GP01]
MPTFIQKCQDWQLTVLDLPTAYWHLLTVELVREHLLLPDTLRLVIIGGEQVSPVQLRAWLEYVGSSPRLVNTYGPTEATVVTTLCKLSDLALEEVDRGGLSIGKPIHNVQVYILDKYLQPVPIGVHGELYIGGAGLSQGYLHRPDLTQEKFISVNTAQDTSIPQRLYKTGDLARYLPDGNIQFLGRIDHQVKIRGFRIELSEIETVIGSKNFPKG